jgi:hypothetical protein
MEWRVRSPREVDAVAPWHEIRFGSIENPEGPFDAPVVGLW